MTYSAWDHDCMARALRLARRGINTTDPNPRVGCVLSLDERIIGEGWHVAAGGAHAEIAAINDAAQPVRGATAYVTLEPCSYHGRTPPCSAALIEAGVSRVVAAIEDPNERVSGAGLQQLRDAGVKVETGLMAGLASEINTGFIKRMTTGRPWVRIKSAVSLDGRTALKNGESQWITGPAAREDVQRWRARASAVLTGMGTVLADDPRMTARVAGPVTQPLRVVVDSQWRLSLASRIAADPSTLVIAGIGPPPASLESSGATCLELPAAPGGVDLEALLRELGSLELNEIHVEAGSALSGALTKQALADEWLLYVAPTFLGDGGPGPAAIGPLESMNDRTHFRLLETVQIGKDMRFRLEPLNHS